MIDLDRAKERVYHALGWLQGNIQEPAFYGSCDKIDEITDDVEALCREVEELRRELNNSRREPHFIQYKESK